MDFTFFPPRGRVRRPAAPKEPSQESVGPDNITQPPLRAGATSQGLPAAEVRTLTFEPRDMIALSQLHRFAETEQAQGATSFQVQVGETPAEFVHLYAGLERIISKVRDVPLVTMNLLENERPYVLGVTSAVAGEGKTTTALHLAMTIARSTPKRVGLIDLSLTDSDLAKRMGMPPSGEGLVATIEDSNDDVPCFRVTGCDNLMILPAGRVPANPARFVRLPRIAQFLVATRNAFDLIIIDMPAVASENAVPLARYTDGILMVVRAGVTPREIVSEAVEIIGTDRVNSVILNRSKPSVPKWLQKRFGQV